MGGSINMAFRFSDGSACCFDRWTNNISVLSDISLFGDEGEKLVRDYIAMCRNNDFVYDPHATGRPVRLSTSGYGLVLIDFMTKTIIDANGYRALFGEIQAFEIRDENDKKFNDYDEDSKYWACRWTRLLRGAITSGKAVIETERKLIRKKDGSTEISDPIVRRYTKLSDMEGIIEKANKNRYSDMRSKDFYVYGIDISPWTYHHLRDTDSGLKKALKLARDINFPFTRKEGLNANFPPPKTNGKASVQERKARYVWQKMKAMPKYKEFDGVPWERLSKDTRATILDYTNNLTDEDFRQSQLVDYIGSINTKAVVKITA